MDYPEVLDFMYSSLPMYQRVGKAAYKADLKNSLEFDRHFNYPHQNYKSIHIAGTNGKGSVSHLLASVLMENGYKTGLYTSPHLTDYRERIMVDGEKIDKDFVCDFINNNFNFIINLKPSFFEMSVALALDYFRHKNIDIAIIETGMGGRLDSTNILNPILSIITNISYDHTEFLGSTLEQIAEEKAGIIKKEIPVIIGETNPKTSQVFINHSKDKNCKLAFADKDVKIYKKGERLIIESNSLSISFTPELRGIYQLKNYCTAFAGLKELVENKIHIDPESIVAGFEKVIINTGLRGRWQIMSTTPIIICDTAHNKEGIEMVIKQLLDEEYTELHIVIGFVNDKNVKEIIKLFPKEAKYYFCRADIPRAMDEELLYELANECGLQGNVFANVSEAFEKASKSCSENGTIFIGGSTFVVADFLQHYDKSIF